MTTKMIIRSKNPPPLLGVLWRPLPLSFLLLLTASTPSPVDPSHSHSQSQQPHASPSSSIHGPTPLNLRFPGDDHRKPSQRMSNSALILHAARHAEDAVVNAFYSGYGRHPGHSNIMPGENEEPSASASSAPFHPRSQNPLQLPLSAPVTPAYTYPSSQSFPFESTSLSSHHGDAQRVGRDDRSFDQSVSIIFPHYYFRHLLARCVRFVIFSALRLAYRSAVPNPHTHFFPSFLH